LKISAGRTFVQIPNPEKMKSTWFLSSLIVLLLFLHEALPQKPKAKSPKQDRMNLKPKVKPPVKTQVKPQAKPKPNPPVKETPNFDRTANVQPKKEETGPEIVALPQELLEKEKLPVYQMKLFAPALLPDDTILFIGSANSGNGKAFDHGFINVFEKEVHKTMPNLKASFVPLNSLEFGQFFKGFQQHFTSTNFPTKLVFIFDQDHFHQAQQSTDNNLNQLSVHHRNLESLLNRLIHLRNDTVPFSSRENHPFSIILATLVVKNEGLDYAQEQNQLMFDEWIFKFQLLSQFYPEIHYVDLATPVLKFIELVNVESKTHSVLTYDGIHLNATGHLLIAVELLTAFLKNRSLGWSFHHLLEDLRSEIEQAKLLKQNLMNFQNVFVDQNLQQTKNRDEL
jgi:hypothetical protein